MACKFDDFWKQKIRAHLQRLDTDNSGVLTKADLENTSARYSELNAEKGQQMRVALFKVYPTGLRYFTPRCSWLKGKVKFLPAYPMYFNPPMFWIGRKS